MSGKVLHPHSPAEFNELFERSAKAGMMLVVDFSMNGCGWCVKIAPLYTALAKQYPGANFCKIMAEECGDVCRKYGVRGFPHFKFFVGGDLKATISGGGPRAEAELKANCKKLYVAGATGKVVGWSSGGVAPVQAPHVTRKERKAMHKFLEQFTETSVNQAFHFLSKNAWDHERACGAYLEAVVDGSSSVPDYFGKVADSYLPRSRQRKKRTAASAPRAAAAAPLAAGMPPPSGLERQSSADRAAAAGNLFASSAATATAGAGGAAVDTSFDLCPGGVCPLPGGGGGVSAAGTNGKPGRFETLDLSGAGRM